MKRNDTHRVQRNSCPSGGTRFFARRYTHRAHRNTCPFALARFSAIRYKIAACVLSVLSVLSVAAEWLLGKSKEAHSIAIIGGADGPTSIFIAGKIGGSEIFTIAAVIFLAAAAALLILSRKKK